MVRVSRVESQQQTREALVASARRHFGEVGYAKASLDRIAEDAGFTRGAVYANFEGKPGLLFAVLDARLEQQVAELEDAGGDLEALGAWRERNAAREAGLSLAVQEFRVVALRDDQLRAQLRDRERRVRAGFAEVIGRAADEAGVPLPLPAEDIAVVLLALGEGITQQHQLDPGQVDAGLFETTLALLIQAFTT